MSLPDSRVVIRAIVGAKGSIPLAAERLNIGEADIIDIITEDDSALAVLQRKCAVLMNVWTFELIMQAQVAVLSQLDSLDGRDAAQTYTELLKAYAQLNNKGNEIARGDVLSMIESIAQERGLPPEAASQAVRTAERLLRGATTS